MSLHIFDKDLEKANLWLQEVMSELNLDENNSYNTLKGFLHELRDRLTLEETAHFSAELPRTIRGIFFKGWKPTQQPIKYTKSEFISRVHSYTGNNPNLEPNELVSSMFNVILKLISEGEVKDIKSILPKEMKELV